MLRRARPALAVALVLAGAAGCRTTAPAGPAAATPVDAREAARLVALDNERVAHLGRLFSNGVIELDWIDDEGRRHREPQVNAKLWIERPRRTALRAEKLGENVFWIGSDEQHYWFFDLMNEPSVLHVGRHEQAPAAAASALLIRPLALLDLLALTPIEDPVVEPDPDPGRSACVVRAAGAGGPMRVYLRREDGLPIRVESLSAEGAVVLASNLSRYATVPVPGVALGARPYTAKRIEIADPAGRVSIRLFLDEPAAEDPGDRWDRVFDVRRLTAALRPDAVRRVAP